MEHGETTAVDHFLTEFKVKLKIWNIIFWSDRQKNTQTMAELEISVNDAIAVLENLSIEDYSQGPLLDHMLNGAPVGVWQGGKRPRDLH